ncbi:MAG: YjjG family noncanonical pyrimidine nucleotidase [Luteibaculum sp.]
MKHLFFDLDRTLWDFDKNSRETLLELADFFQLKKKYGISETSFISKYERINRTYWSLYQSGRLEREALRVDRFYYTLESFGVIDKVLAEKISTLYLEECPKKSALMEHALEMLQHFYGRFPMHIITNGFTATQSIKLQSSGLGEFFQHVITSDLAGAQKPSQKIFNLSWEKAGKPDKKQCYYIGDDWNADVRGSKQFGFTPIWFSTEERKTKILQVRSHKRLMEILD